MVVNVHIKMLSGTGMKFLPVLEPIYKSLLAGLYLNRIYRTQNRESRQTAEIL